MEKNSALLSGSNAQESSTEVAVDSVSSSTGHSCPQNDRSTDENISRTSVLTSENKNEEENSQSSLENSTLSVFSVNSPKDNSLPFESSDKPTDMSGIGCGFDSADSTNDADFLNTQKAVLSAIDLMDEGLKDEEEILIDDGEGSIKDSNVSNIHTPTENCGTITDTPCSLNPENQIGKNKINSTGTIGVSDSPSTQVQLENVHEDSGESYDSSIVKNVIPMIGSDKKNSENGLKGDTKKKPTIDTKNIVNNPQSMDEGTKTIDGVSNESNREIQRDIDDEYTEKESNNLNNSSSGLQNSGKVCFEVSAKDCTSGNKICDKDKFEQCHPKSDMVPEKQNTLDQKESHEVITLGEIATSSRTEEQNEKNKPGSPVCIELSDVEVSVFIDEKTDEFKLDDMVLSTDEDSNHSQHMQDDTPNSNVTSKDIILDVKSDVSIIAETSSTSVEKSAEVEKTINLGETQLIEATEPQNTLEEDSEIEVMDVEDINTVQEGHNESKQEETTKMDLEESNDGSERKITLSEPTNTESLSNESLNKVSLEIEEIEVTRSPKSNDCKEDSEAIDGISKSLSDTGNENEKVIGSKSLDSNEKEDENKEIDLVEIIKATLAKNEKFRENFSLESSEVNNKGSSETSASKDAEVICLVDDDDDDDDDITEKKKPAAAVNCVNPNCMSGEDLAPPAMFVLSYFGLKRSKGQQVCVECFNSVVEHQELLSSLLKERKPMFSAKFPSHKDVILLDSDEESLSDNDSVLSDDTMSMIREHADDVISECLAKYDFNFQIQESCNIINNTLTKLEEEAREITTRYDDVQRSLDEARKRIYEEFQQETKEKEEAHFTHCEIPPMPIIKSKLQNQLYNRELMNRLRKSQQEREYREAEEQQMATLPRTIATKKVSQHQMSGENVTQDVTFVRTETKCEPPPNLPPPGPLIRPKLKVGDLLYTMKVSYFSIWVHCRVIEVIPRNPSENDPSTETYRVKLENVKKNAVRTVIGRYLAYPTPARVQLKVGVRVIAIFKEEDDSGATKDNYYVGVIAEPPKSTNKYRYLVFFDDGYTQYCPHENVLVVCATSKNVWEDIHPEPRDFIKNYLQQYPERPMVKLSRGQIVKVEWNGRWWIVRVLEVDGSLVKVHFDADKRTEWIYRGSTRLGPMYQELAAAKERQHGSLLRSRGFGGGSHHKSDMPYVEYTRGDVDGDNENKPEEKDEKTEELVEQTPAPRSVARKSTAKKPTEPTIANTNYSKPLLNHLPEGRLRQRKLKPKCRPIIFRPHQCSEACVAWTGHNPAAANKYDPLVKPLMFGFERLLGSFKGKSIVTYRAPCGRMIRTQQEMICYLRGTRSQLTIDLFDFDFWVNPLNEFEEGSTFGKIEDLSYGKENIRISCVNELDHSMPQYVQYMTAREPAKDVHLNLDPEFLVGCECTDDCEDRSKCSCWQLTMQGKAYVPDGDLDPLFGYQYRRLPERIATGIYECNSRCKCSMTCQNRVAQQPLSCRLQLFKTLKKGWGIRCLHDIPRGAFICIYAGFLLTEQEANEGGKTYGDEYLAELDYIESVENLKEGYESEAKDPSDLEDDDDISQKDLMDIEYDQSEDSDVEVVKPSNPRRQEDIRLKTPPPLILPPHPLPPPSLPWTLRLRRRTAEEAEKESRRPKMDDDSISISDDELDSVRKPKTFDANITVNETEDGDSKFPSVRELYGPEENVYIMDAKTHGNIGRYLNHSCSPNVFVQNVFVDTHDLRFPWVAFFANQYIQAGTELTWDYNYDVGSVPGKVMLCYCGSNQCRGRLL